MRRFTDWPMNRKLSAVVLLTAGLLIGVMITFVTVEKYFSFRNSLKDNIIAVADIIGINSTAALTFQDAATAHEILGALRGETNIITACLFNENNEVFSVYHTVDVAQQPVCPLPAHFPGDRENGGELFTSDRFFLTRPIKLNGKMIGSIVIRADLSLINRRIRIFVAMLLGFSLLLLGTALLVCSRLNQALLRPVTTLAESMQLVSREKNYTIRVSKKHGDELGILIDGFNDMLAQIEKRDRELYRHRNRLADLVEQRTEELSRSNAKLLAEIEERKAAQDQLAHAQKMEAIGTLAGGVAHDLNNILSGVVSYPDLLIANLPQHSSMRGPLERIRSSGKKAAAIVQDLLTLARRGVKVDESIDLASLIRAYIESPECADLRRNHPGVSITFRLPDEPIPLRGSPLHLEKMLMNLIANAAEAMPEGGQIDISCSPLTLEKQPPGFRDWRPGRFVELIIADRGIGIPKQYIERIFEPFFSRKVMGRSGTGLGMAVVWGTVEDHFGTITVESEEGRGTAFRIILPLAEQDRIPDTTADIELRQGGEETVLIVDDSEQQREIAANILHYLGYRVHAVGSGEDAVEYVRRQRVDLVLLDMLMDPGIDGLETYRRIIEIHPGQKAVIASGFSLSQRVREALALGVSDYVIKPYTLVDISKAVHRALDGREPDSSGQASSSRIEVSCAARVN